MYIVKDMWWDQSECGGTERLSRIFSTSSAYDDDARLRTSEWETKGEWAHIEIDYQHFYEIFGASVHQKNFFLPQ